MQVARTEMRGVVAPFPRSKVDPLQHGHDLNTIRVALGIEIRDCAVRRPEIDPDYKTGNLIFKGIRMLPRIHSCTSVSTVG